MIDMDLVLFLARDLLWSAVAALGFAVLFNVPRRALAACAVAGAIGHFIRTLTQSWGADLTFASFFGATAVGFVGYWLSRRWHMPMPVFTVPGIIPLIPGSFAFGAIANLINAFAAGPDAAGQWLVLATLDALTTALVLIALGVGISAPILLFRRDKPVV